MGSHDFSDLAFGKTAFAAYTDAVRNAQYEHGHEPYNGTISTTSGVLEISIPKGWSSDEWESLIWLIRWEEPYEERPTTGLSTHTRRFWDPRSPGRAATLPTLKVQRVFANEWERRHYQQRRALLTKAKKLTHDDLVTATHAADRINKWESCVCWKVPAREEKNLRASRPHLKGKHGAHYHFIGIAAC
jgi:hypothetical protein